MTLEKIKFSTIAATLVLALAIAGGAPASGQEDNSESVDDTTPPKPGSYMITKRQGKRPSHEGALVSISEPDGTNSNYGIVFALTQGADAGKFAYCNDAKHDSSDGAIECELIVQSANDEEWLRIGALESKYCKDWRAALNSKFPGNQNPIMATCNKSSCICFNNQHCDTGKTNCNKGDIASASEDKDSLIKALGPPDNGSGSGGRWP